MFHRINSVSANSQLCPLKPRKLLLGVQRPDLMKYSCAHIFILKASSVKALKKNEKVDPLFLEDTLCCWLLSCVVQTAFFLKESSMKYTKCNQTSMRGW